MKKVNGILANLQSIMGGNATIHVLYVDVGHLEHVEKLRSPWLFMDLSRILQTMNHAQCCIKVSLGHKVSHMSDRTVKNIGSMNATTI